MKILKIFEVDKENYFDFFYLMTIGVLTAWVMVSGIIDTTIFARTHFQTFRKVLLLVASFGLAFKFVKVKIALLIALGVGFLIAFFGFISLSTSDYATNLPSIFVQYVINAFDFAMGNRRFNRTYETVIIWGLSIIFSFLVTAFTFHKFRFWVIFPLSIVTASIAITSPYFRNYTIFYIYIFCILTLAVIHLSGQNKARLGRGLKSSISSKIAIPLTGLVVILASFIPTPNVFATDGFFHTLINRPLNFINNVFLDITQPDEFSISRIGFGGSGRLGGNVELNDEVFMKIYRTGFNSLYLKGATRDTFTGYSWENRHDEYELFARDTLAHNAEIIEILLRSEIFLLSFPFNMFSIENLIQINIFDYALEIFGVVIDIDESLENDSDPWFFFLNEVMWFRNEETGHVISLNPNQEIHEWNTINITNIQNESLHNAPRQSLKIDTLNRRTSNIFTVGPVSSFSFLENENQIIKQNRDARLKASDRMNRNTQYRLHQFILTPLYSFIPNPYNPEGWKQVRAVEDSYRGILYDFISLNSQFRDEFGFEFFESWIRNGNQTIHIEEIVINYLIPRSNRIHEIYTQLPDAFPERVRDLAKDVTKEGENNFQKMTMLEQFLNSSFTYTLTPGPSPQNQDFVDYFLFDLQMGYCVHFATAFVTMARSLGMPARYVEGFLVVDRTREVYVLNNMAHAWAEVYFEGYGWVRFEPTPASGLPSAALVNRPVTPGDNANRTGFIHEHEGPYGPYENGNRSNNLERFNPNNVSSTTNATNYEVNGQTSDSTWFWLLSFKILIISFLIARLIYLHTANLRLIKKNDKEITIARFKQLLYHLKLLGFTMEKNETPILFSNRIEEDFTVFLDEQKMLKDCARIYSKARYSNGEIGLNEHQVIDELIVALDYKIFDKFGKYKYWVYKYIFVKI